MRVSTRLCHRVPIKETTANEDPKTKPQFSSPHGVVSTKQRGHITSSPHCVHSQHTCHSETSLVIIILDHRVLRNENEEKMTLFRDAALENAFADLQQQHTSQIWR